MHSSDIARDATSPGAAPARRQAAGFIRISSDIYREVDRNQSNNGQLVSNILIYLFIYFF